MKMLAWEPRNSRCREVVVERLATCGDVILVFRGCGRRRGIARVDDKHAVRLRSVVLTSYRLVLRAEMMNFHEVS